MGGRDEEERKKRKEGKKEEKEGRKKENVEVNPEDF
jgi:hypothetical protein